MGLAEIEQKIGDLDRMDEMLGIVARMAAGESELRLPITQNYDQLDALAHGINILAQELSFCLSVLKEEKDAVVRVSRAKSVFVAEVSHDIRTPLMAIASFAEFLGRETLSPEKRAEYLERVKANCRTLNALVNEVLDLSRLEAGAIHLDPVETSVRDKVREAVSALEPLAKQKSLSIEVGIDSNVPRSVLVDPLRFWQVVNNLLGNAIKFSQDGVVRLFVGFEEGDLLSVEVVDRGIGVPPEAQSKLFQPFMQADGSVARRFGGSGLGLALSRDLCRAMGGDLTLVRSEPGKGSHFRATLVARLVLARDVPGGMRSQVLGLEKRE